MTKLKIFDLFKISFKKSPIKSFVLLCALSILACITSIQIFCSEKMVSLINAQVDFSKLWFVLLAYILLCYTFTQIFDDLQNLLKKQITNDVDNEVKKSIMKKVVELPLPSMETGMLPNTISRLLFQDQMSIERIYENLISLFSSIVALIVMCISFKAAGICIVLICLVLTIYKEHKNKQLSFYEYEYRKEIEELDRYCKTLKAILMERKYAAEIKCYGVQDEIIRKWEEKKLELDNKQKEFCKITAKKKLVISFIDQVRLFLGIITIFLLYKNSVISLTLAISFIYPILQIGGLCDSLLGCYTFYQISKIPLSEYNDLCDIENEGASSKMLEQMPPTIEFKDVSYRYPNGKENALNHVSFCIKPGEKVVLVGDNGSGKSTIIRLMLGLDRPQSGHIYINGHELAECTNDFRKHTTVLLQKYMKYELTFRENMIASDFDKEDNDKFWETVQWTDMEELINRKEEMLDMEIIHGGNFSGGEWQKIANARAKYKDANIVLLDEPNSAIDAIYETLMYQRYLELFEQCSALVVSHRLSICQICSKIIYMDHGQVLEQGSHEELLNQKGGKYCEIYHMQASLYQ